MGTLSDLMGGVSDVLSAPRRALWSGASNLFGTPDNPLDLLESLGMDKSSGLAQALAFGLEQATDPVNWAMAGAGGLAGKALFGARGSAGARMAENAALTSQAQKMAEAAQGFSKGAGAYDEAAQSIARQAAQRGAADVATEQIPVRARDLQPKTNRFLNQQTTDRFQQMYGDPTFRPSRDAMAAGRQDLMNALSQQRDLEMAQAQMANLRPEQSYSDLLRAAAMKSQSSSADLLQQAAQRMANPGLLEQGFMSQQLSPFEKAALLGVGGGSIGGGIYAGMANRGY